MNETTECICGEFEEPENPDLGQSVPYREFRTCEAPTIPTLTTMIYTPNGSVPFTHT